MAQTRTPFNRMQGDLGGRRALNGEGAQRGGPGGHGRAPPAPPPGGANAVAQQTQAAQLTTFMFAPGFGRAASRPTATRAARATKRRRKLPMQRRKKRAAKRGKKMRFVKGSAAAKRYMAKLRRMQKRK